MSNDVKVIFDWANQIGDSNINNRILAKVIHQLMEEKITLTDSIINESQEIIVSQNLYNAIKNGAEILLGVEYK